MRADIKGELRDYYFEKAEKAFNIDEYKKLWGINFDQK